MPSWLTDKRTLIVGGSLVALVALIVIVAVARGGDSKKAAPPPPPVTTTTAGLTPGPPVYPLTGLPVTDPAMANRPALVVKIDNADSGCGNSARPQIGINQADVVYEEMVEGSVSRLAAVFQSTDATSVGPVRSARSTDVEVFSPLNTPLFAWSGANPTFADLIHSSPIIDVGYDAHSEVYSRQDDSCRRAPHDLYTDTPALYGLAPPDAKPPSPLFTYVAPYQPLPATASPVGSVHLEWGGGPGNAPDDWTWHPELNGFARDQHGSPDIDANGQQVVVPNVIVQNVNYIDTGITDVVGTPVPEGQLVGDGDCWVLTQGKLIPCHWNKPSNEVATTYTVNGQPVPLTPGRTWVELVPNGGATQTG